MLLGQNTAKISNLSFLHGHHEVQDSLSFKLSWCSNKVGILRLPAIISNLGIIVSHAQPLNFSS